MRSINILKKTLVALTLTLATTGAFTTKAEAKLNKIKVTSPSGKTVRVAKGKKVKLKTTVKKLKNKKVKFKSNNPKVARVTAKGFVKGIKKGKTKIVVSSKSNPKIKKTIKVVVYKKAVKKIKLNKKNISLKKNQQFKLVAKVSPKKNVSKVLSYKSSNKKVATVTKKGIIKAVAAGMAKITVKATDGSKKKTTCIVTVKGSNGSDDEENNGKTVGIKSVTLRSGFALDVVLTKAKFLTDEDVKILCKPQGGKKFEDIFNINSIYTSDNIHYSVSISRDRIFEYNSDLKVVISSLNGVKEMVVHVDKWYGATSYGYNDTCKFAEGINYLPRDLGYSVGDSFNKKEDFREFIRADIKKITVSNLPKGLEASYSEDGSIVYVKGTFAEKAYGLKTVITAIDMNDDEFIIEWNFYIGDENTLYAKAEDRTFLSYWPNESFYMKGTIDFSTSICFSVDGLSRFDCSNFTAEGLPDNTYIASNSGYIFIKDAKKPVKAGVYNITFSGTIPNGKTFKTTCKYTIVDGIVVEGKLTDPSGKPMVNERIIFLKKFYFGTIEVLEDVTTDENGYYKRRFIPGIYDVKSEFDNVFNSYFVDFSESQTYDMKSSCYKVVFANSIINKVAVRDEISSYLSRKNRVFDAKGYEYEVISRLDNYENSTYKFSLFTYVKKGTYNFGDGILNMDCFKSKESYKVLTKQFTVSESGTVNIDLEKVE